jgi:hypothetical protein
MGVSLGGIGAAVGGISALGSLFGGNKQPTPPPPSYQLQNAGGADTGAYSGIGQLPQYNTYGQSLPYAQNTFQNLYNNPYAGQFQQGANTAAGVGWGVGGQQVGAGSNLMSAGQSLLPYQQQILQSGFDPMQNIYNTQQQQNTDQTRAAEAARGIATTPYGAGVENQSNLLFNQAWQNNLLNRQNTAAQGAGYLGNSAGNQINLGQNVSTLGLQTLNNAAQLPYSTANTIGGNQFGALNQYGQYGANASQNPQQQIQDYLQYLGVGNQAAGVANQQYANQLTAQQQQFNQNQALGKALGSSLSGLGTWYNNSGFGSSGSNPFSTTGSLY